MHIKVHALVRILFAQPSNFVMSLRIFSVRGRRSDKWTVPVITLLGDGLAHHV
jgi:hypothetical protein